MEKYNHKKTEAKWQKKWEKEKLYQTADSQDKPKYYILDMFPYPSGAGLHVGHPKGYIATDIFARAKMMQGFNVLHPMGWDAFGLPAENYAIANKIHPREATEKNIATFKRQLGLLGFTYDWDREINTTDPEYYKWTQWTFIKMFERGLAYESNEPVNWCPGCKTVLSNEDLENGLCERCGSEVERKPMRQWVLKITDYADRLLKDLEKLPAWEESIKEMQRNWIGRSEGAMFKLAILPAHEPKTKYEKILLSTNNLSKKDRVEKLLRSLGIATKVLLPKDLSIKVIETDEAGSLADNAKEKALAYRDKTDLPILGFDTGFFIEGEAIDPVKVKRNALKGKDEKKLTQEKIAELMHEYYKGIVRKRGGKVEAYFQDELALSLADGTIEAVGDTREIILTDQMKGKMDIYFPIRSLYLAKATGKYAADQNEAEELKELEPFTQSLNKLLGQAESKFLEVFTTRLDTVFGMTYAVIAPEHKIINELKPRIANWPEVEKYLEETKNKTDLQRMETKEKTGVKLEGVEAVNPFTNEAIPIFTADYVLAQYGTGAVMAVPAHDERDFEFAQSHGLQFQEVINTTTFKLGPLALGKGWPYTEDGILAHSGGYSGLTSAEAREKMTAWLEKEKLGRRAVNYKLKDWVFSRQRYWGEPIPIVRCEKCGNVAVPYDELPLKLPEVKNYEPTGTGESPLANIKEWVNTKCPKCGGEAKRETNTMPQWAGSSWYYLRFIDPHNNQALVDKTKEKYWSPVDFYVGGAEHATRHLIYARFWHKFLYDLGAVNYDEPFTRLQHVGLILAEDGRKMSKRWGNVINPDEIVEKFGADAMRVYEMFMGPFKEPCAWSTNGLIGARRFLENVWKLKDKKLYDCQGGDCKVQESGLPQMLHKTIKKVSQDIENFHYNTAIAQMMIFINLAGKFDAMPRGAFENFLKLLAPFAPYLAEELWAELGNKESIFKQSWPKFNPALVKDETINLVIQVNGKLRDTIKVSADISEEEAKKLALENEKIKKWTEEKNVVKVIFVKGKLVNIVVK
ncbi:MAG: leucine--tRNA ligase [bacterium]|nr:leucine--tRNA ligase [bacterium]